MCKGVSDSEERLKNKLCLFLNAPKSFLAMQAPIKSFKFNSRRIWLACHRWIAVGAGWILAGVGLTGAFLVVAPAVDHWAHPQLFNAEGALPSSRHPDAYWKTLRQRLIGEFGRKAALPMRPPRTPGKTLRVVVRSSWSGTLYLNPVTGIEQGRRSEEDDLPGFVFRLHNCLLLQETGKAILAWIAIAYLLLLISGLAVWWPTRWPPSFRIAFNRGLLRALFDMHRVGGAVLGLFIAISVATGAYMAWRPIGQFVSALNGDQVIKPPSVAVSDARPVTLDLWQRRKHNFRWRQLATFN